MQDFSEKKREQLERSIRENLDLLGQYRHQRNLSRDPRERNSLDDQIKDLNTLIEAEQKELELLNKPVPAAHSQPAPGPVEVRLPHAPIRSGAGKAALQDNQATSDGYENEVFVSYAWGGDSEHTVDELEQAFLARGLRIVRDKKDLAYKGSIAEFERRIAQGQCIVLVISDKYLRSEHCMYELVEADKNRNLRDRIFPIVLADAKIFKAIERLAYINYWDEQIEQLNQAIRNSKSVANLSGITATLDKYTNIRASVDHLTDLLHDMNTLTPDLLAADGFSRLITAVLDYTAATRVGSPSSGPVPDRTTQVSSTYARDILEMKAYLDQFTRKIDQGASNLNILFTAQGMFENLAKTVSRMAEDMQELPEGTTLLPDLKRISEISLSICSLLRSAAGSLATGRNADKELNHISGNLPLLRSLLGQLSLWLENNPK